MTPEFIKSQKKSRTSDRIGVWTVWFILSNDSLPANQLLLLTSIINRQWLCFWHRDWSTKENYFWKILFLYICQKEIKNSIKSLLFLLILYERRVLCFSWCLIPALTPSLEHSSCSANKEWHLIKHSLISLEWKVNSKHQGTRISLHLGFIQILQHF